MREFKQLKRIELYELIWSQPTIKVAADLGISDVGLGKICKKLGIPKPGLGYWAKVAARKYPPKVPLPNGPYPREYTYVPHYKPEVPQVDWLGALEAYENDPDNHIFLPETLESCHPSIKRAQKHLEKRFKKKADCTSAGPGAVPDMLVSPDTYIRALRIMQALLSALKQRGHPVTFEQGHLYVTLQGEHVEISIKEKKRKQASDKEDLCTSGAGRLSLYMDGQAERIGDLATMPLEERLNEYLITLYRRVARLQEWREQRRLEKIEEEKRRIAREDAARRQQVLDGQMETFCEWFKVWEEQQKLARFIIELEKRVTALPKEHEAHQILQVAKEQWAKRDYLDSRKLWIKPEDPSAWQYRWNSWNSPFHL